MTELIINFFSSPSLQKSTFWFAALYVHIKLSFSTHINTCFNFRCHVPIIERWRSWMKFYEGKGFGGHNPWHFTLCHFQRQCSADYWKMLEVHAARGTSLAGIDFVQPSISMYIVTQSDNIFQGQYCDNAFSQGCQVNFMALGHLKFL